MESKVITIPFTAHFIDSLAEYIHHLVLSGQDPERIMVVFGGRRPALFLRRSLARLSQKAFIPPKIKTIDEFISLMATDGNLARPLGDLEHAYIIYQLVNKWAPRLLKGRESFAQFLPWAREVAHFIEQVDLQALADRDLLDVGSHAKIGFDVPKQINELLQDIAIIRREYHVYLQEHQVKVRGYEYWQASKQLSTMALDDVDVVIFANFFYLHRTEMTIFKRIYDQGKAILFMQGDERRWPALKRISAQFHQPIVEGPQVIETSFDLSVYAASDVHTQAAMIAKLLKKIGKNDNTVIVLPNADFILPLLSALEDDLGDFNISLGYPLKRSSVFVLLELVVALQQSMKDGLVYSRDYVRLWHHPLIKTTHIDEDPTVLTALVVACQDVLTGKMVSPLTGALFIRLKDVVNDDILLEAASTSLKKAGIERSRVQLAKVLEQMHQVFILNWMRVENFSQLAQALQALTQCLSVNQESQYLFNKAVINLMEDLVEQYVNLPFANDKFDRDDLFRIFLDSLGQDVVGFTGSPLRGLQILGLFETRSLNFDHVIVADGNEGVLPNLNIYEPLIPREVMISLNIDRLELEEEIQRYGFMRLIAAAKSVHLVYLSRGEKVRSRFIEELIWEQERRSNVLGVVPVERAAFGGVINQSIRQVDKTEDMVAFLKSFIYSASSLNTYLLDPYTFYINHVLKLREQDDLLDDPDSRQVGTFIHGLLESAFKPWIGKKPVIDDAFIKMFFDVFEREFNAVFGQQGRSDSFMMRAIMKTRLKRFLDSESQRCKLVKEVLYVEKKFTDVIDLAAGRVSLTYRVDRVDLYEDGTVMIIDYKTGGAEQMPVSLESLDQLISFQMPLYIDYMARLYPNQPVNCGLYHLRTNQLELFLNQKRNWTPSEVSALQRQLLEKVIAEIWDIHTPFKENKTFG